MAIWYAQSSSVDFNASNQWNSIAAGGGTAMTFTYPTTGAANGDVFVSNGKTAIAISATLGDSSHHYTLQTSGSANSASGTDGGGFTLTLVGGSKTVYADLLGGTTACLALTGSSTNVFTLFGNSTGGGSSGAHGLTVSSSAPLINIGDATHTYAVTGGTNSSANGINNSVTSGVCTWYANIVGATGVGVLWNASVAAVTLNGNISSSSTNYGLQGVAMTLVHSGNLLMASTGFRFPISFTNTSQYKWTAGGNIQLYDASAALHTLQEGGGLLVNPGMTGGMQRS